MFKSRIDDGGSRIAIFYPLSSILDDYLPSTFVAANDVLCQPPAQHFRRALGDADAAHLAVPPLQRQLAHQPQAAMTLNRAVDHAAGHLGALDLGHVGELANLLAQVR